MNQVTLHNDSIYQVKVPLPFPLRWVNSYLIRGSSGYTVIDPGLHTEAAVQHWDSVLQSLQIRYQDIEQVVLTHHHPDHYGLTGWFQERSGAPVRLSSAGAEQVRRLWGKGQPMTSGVLELFRRHGLPDELGTTMREHMDSFVPMVSPQPELSLLTIGDDLRLGDRMYETVHTPGHAFGHVCFYQKDQRHMFCGDQVIPQISPNVSYLPGGIDENPLASFLHSLKELSVYDVAQAYPGHREPFGTFNSRIQELLAHHESRLQVMYSLLADQPLTAYQVCRATFGERLSLHQLRFALSETLAHLIYLREAGRLQETEYGGVITYGQAEVEGISK